MRHLRSCAIVILLSLACSASSGGETLIRFLVGDAVVEGSPLVWQEGYGAVLARDGRWLSVDPKNAKNLKQVSGTFRPYSSSDLRGLLQQEFGKKFDVSATGHYLVVYPRGQRLVWADRFEELYRAFVQYFTSRGWRPQEPTFPLTAVVFPNETEFRAYANREGSRIQPNTLGYYSPISNRILLYDVTAGRPEVDASVNFDTIIHEAAHQTAFNTGVHNRFANPSRWLVEGLGTMFEAKGIWNAARYRTQSDRINRHRFEEFQRYAAGRRKTGALAELVSSDRMFDGDIDGAYAEAWALTFFLSETSPHRYTDYIRKTSAVANFSQRRAPERLSDFTAVFGQDLNLLESRMLRFMKELK